MADTSSAPERQGSRSFKVGEGIQILIGHALWAQWGEIAVEREGRARSARADLIALDRHQQEFAPAMYDELLASLVGRSRLQLTLSMPCMAN
jgi:hypothetical protein